MDGWVYEQADPTVGIFGEGWWHEDCPGPNGDGGDSEDGYPFGVTELDSKVTCDGCGGFFYLPEPEYDAEMAANSRYLIR